MQVTVAEVALDARDGVWVIVAEAIVAKELARVVEDTILRDVILSCRLASRCFSSEFYSRKVYVWPFRTMSGNVLKPLIVGFDMLVVFGGSLGFSNEYPYGDNRYPRQKQ